ncbi:MAG: L,D-transpeptidase [Actinomycetota bacterium]|nr:L,D-transpeptidase [Actinomycetota bacterium]
MRRAHAAPPENAAKDDKLPRFMVIALVAVTSFTAACGSGPSRGGMGTPVTSLSPTVTVPATGDTTGSTTGSTTIVAQAITRTVPVFVGPGDTRPRMTLASPQPSGAPLIFVVRESRRGWLRVLLPVRPNGSSGWIRQADVRLSQHDYDIVVELHAHRITVFKGSNIADREPVGVGRAQTPTPGGVYYTKELLRPLNPNGVYGPFAYQLSGFSDVLTRFNGGEGVIGIHGTNEPWLIGKDVSHGCIRMSNAGITRLAHMLPLGVPVEIRP